ncbi:MAG TPA: CehA/McbA family metallohydrolase [Gemmatimonadales bacterium]|nr:CehA/McbA family metallohydrolase [Gemmatimonadales bacterium]
MLLGAIWTAVACGPGSSAAHAQREPVLTQIREPHSYYYREMYLPQATSGPNGAAWSPDGRELVYAMQGTLWRQRLGSDEARQLTDGPGYDAEPDWSPDGRWIAYASYVNDAVELRLLDLSTGESAALLANGAVNLEPRWSPDGARLAFVSTSFEGRWHVFLAPVRDGSMGTPVRITEDRESGLPRYYYSTRDQYLSPAWSPDGRELVLVSNRGHVWGSGSLWRMRADSGAPMREIHDEETTWRARPDWARDGRRLVFASYAGRQWHQLYLMTSEGENPLQLTYGEFDASSPRWSPDGRRIAYISNETGNTSLWVVEVPGGARNRVQPTRREYLRPQGRLRIETIDAATGRAVRARLSVTGPDGRGWAPDDAWRHADDGFDRRERRFEYTYFHAAGRSELSLPAGEFTVEATRGPEYAAARSTVAIAAGSTRVLRMRLRRIDDLAARGWWSADLHVHLNYGGNYRSDPARLRAMAEAEDLHLVENLIVNKEGRVPEIGRAVGRDPASTRTTLIVNDQEYHTSYWGHSGLLGLRSHVILPGYAAYTHTAAASLYPTNLAVFEQARAQGAVTGYVHPFDEPPDPADDRTPLTNELPVDVAHGRVDYMEIVGFSDHLSTASVWYRLLNCGFRIPTGAGTDAMTNFASLRGPVGMNRVYVKAPGPLSHAAFLAGLKAGRSFATNGPLLTLTLGGRGPGDEIGMNAPGRLRLRAVLRSFVPVDHFELVSNGEVVASFGPGADGQAAVVDTTIAVERSGWYTLRAWSDHGTHPVLDIYPFATTSPVYVTVGGRPVRSRADAEWFIAWLDRLDRAARAHREWNDEAERNEVLREIAEARAEFVRRATP